ncbi:hypothetical protein [Pseudoalteromonas sp. T1lg22]|uniref:hypothetical protein n=1 Tax=Pseudoalteromonas sp. T1lg22 TaxID=2077096 RepID=UPI000CF66A68|nr:hypothetical protein [Pseudoalteromonas sp. T1lg22]
METESIEPKKINFFVKLLDKSQPPYVEFQCLVFILMGLSFALGRYYFEPWTSLPKFLTVVGLITDIIAAFMLAYPVMTTREKAFETSGLSMTSYKDIDPSTSNHPAVVDKLKQSDLAKRGLGLLIIGFTLQLIAQVIS